MSNIYRLSNRKKILLTNLDRNRKGLPIRFEELESRLAPATLTWSGLGTDTNWSTGKNWIGNVAPTGLAADGDDLVFPGSPTIKTTNNDLTSAVVNSISISGSTYTLAGKQLTLGLPIVGSGSFNVNAGSSGNIVSLNLGLGAAAGSDQTFSINTGADLTVTGKISGATGATLTRDGTGTLTLTNDNSGFTGSIRANNNSGSIVIKNAKALGDTAAPTIIGSGSSLRIDTVGTINETLILNGGGVSNLGALINDAGNNTWTGSILLDSNTTLGAQAGVLVITSQITDSSTGHDLVKEGPSEIQFNSPTGNAYRGTTTINNGILTLGNALALGSAGSALSGTTVNQTLTGRGQIRLGDAAGSNFTVKDEFLTLNGNGLDGLGSLSNRVGDNIWAGPIVIGSPSPNGFNVSVGASTVTNMTLSGVISSPNGSKSLIKEDAGRVILNNANTYTGLTNVNQGTLTARDSNALGATGSGTTVSSGATLELEVEAATNTPRFDAQGRDLWNDSVTGDPNRLTLSEPLTISGRGVGGVGALRNVSGINKYITGISLSSAESAIGSEPDQRAGHPTPDASYFTSDYSLTVTATISGSTATSFVKRGTGHLILTNANPYLGKTFIEQGWVTIQNPNALGGTLTGVSDTVQPGTTVNSGAALHIKPLTPGVSSMTIAENLTVSGSGPVHPYAFISVKGALLNLGGNNTYSGDIGLRNATGIGVEQVDPITPSDLVVTGSTADGKSSTQFTASGGNLEFSQVIDTGSTFGTISITYNMYSVPDQLRIYYPPRSAGGTRILDTGFVSGTGTVSATYGPGASTLVEVVVNEGGTAVGTIWDLTDVSISSSGGIIKLGSKKLTLQADGTYSGITQVAEGTLRVQHDTALGEASSGTQLSNQTYISTDTGVSSGAILELTKSVASLNGGVAAGLQIVNEKLTLNTPGQQVGVAGRSGTFQLNYGGQLTASLPITATALAVQDELNKLPTVIADVGSVSVTLSGSIYTVVFGTVQSKNAQTLIGTVAGGAEITISGGNASLVNVSDDNTWRGPVVLANSSRISVGVDSRLSLLGVISDATNKALAGSDLVKRGVGDLFLAGASTYRGLTNLDEGITTIANNTAFGSGTQGTVVANGAQLELQGNLTVAGESLTLQGNGPGSAPNFPNRWLNVGPGPINNSQVPKNLPSTGRITGIAVDPSDSNVIYISSAGGGAWKTKNGGYTWLPLFDNTLNGVMYGGSIALAPTDPRVVYFATGEANNSGDSYAGSGVYKSTDAGRTWALITSATGTANPLFGQAVSKIVVSPANPNLFYLASSNFAVNGLPSGNPGIWRYDGANYFNMISTVSPNRNGVFGQAPFGDPATAGNFGPPRTPGPDDDYRLEFPQTSALWSDISLVGGTLYAALGQPAGGTANANTIFQSAVYRTQDLASNSPVWYVGTPPTTTPDNRTSSYPVNTTGVQRNFNIKIAVAGASIYAVNINPTTGSLLDISKSTDGGLTWAATPTAAPNYVGTQGWYDSTIVAITANYVIVAGQTAVLQTTDGGTTWVDISVDAAGYGPHADHHALVADAAGTVFNGNDGGIWKLETSLNWKNLNGNLRITTLNGVDSHPTDFRIGLAGSQDNGTELFNNDAAWTHVDGGDGGIVHYNQKNPLLAYHVLNGRLRKSTNGGLSWVDVTTLSSPTAGGLYFPFLVDAVNPSRLLVGGFTTALQESSNDGTSWISLNAPIGVGALAIASYQGTFQADPSFALVPDRQANTYDPDTIYITDGGNFSLTKNHGLSWVSRNIPGSGTIVDLAVDPTNRDTVYAIRSSSNGSTNPNRVYKTTDAGRTWTNITGNLPSIPTYRIIVDPRNGNLYVGNDNGVWILPNGVGTTWNRFGAGMPQVQSKEMVLNQALNTLTVGTYGRSMYQLFLTDYLPSSGALRAVSGSSVWTGPVVLTGDTTISVSGTQALQNGVSGATLNIVGTISDSPVGLNALVIKKGQGTLTFSGTNTYGGQTQVQEGVLQVNNPRALGAATPSGNTVVTTGAALELRADLELEPVTINGNGYQFNNHNTGALRNISNNNTYTGPLTLGTDTTIGVDSGTQLRIGASKTLAGTGTITDGASSFGFVKESAGTLVLASLNTYDGLTTVQQGALRVEDGNALGTPGQGTKVIDGAQLQISRNFITSAPTVVVSEPLTLSGTGIFNTGALLNTRGDSDQTGPNDNTWQGPITFDKLPNSFPTTIPGAQVAIGVSDKQDTLILDTTIVENAANGSFGLIKVGPGHATLTKANTYTGLTNVNGGYLRIQNANALGTLSKGTIVANGAALEIDGDPTAVGNSLTVNELLILNGDGPANGGALINVSGNNTYAGAVSLGSDTSISALLNTTLTISSPIQETAPLPVPAPRLRKTGSGTVVFPVANNYFGKTVIDDGVLRIANPQSLGVARSEIQAIQLLGTSGTFTLTFNGQTTTPLLFSATALDVQNALNLLPTINSGGGSVGVTAVVNPGSTTFTVTFGGTLANANQSTLVSSVANGTTAIVTTQQDGAEDTTVLSGGTLQLDGGLTFANETVTINGAGYKNQGALNNFNGNNTWGKTLILGSNASVGTTNAADKLTFIVPITDNGSGFNLDVFGPGTVEFANTTNNKYTGTTTVHEGTLSLNQASGVAILGPLVVGDGIAPSALVREVQSNQIADTVPVTVNSDGTFDLNGQTDTIGKLTINAGSVLLQANGNLTTADLVATGGSISGGDNSKLTSLNVTLSSKASIVLGNTSSITVLNATSTDSSVTVGNDSTISAQLLGLTNSSITLGTTGKLTSTTTTLNKSTITFGDTGTLITADTTLSNVSKIQLGNVNSTATTQKLTLSGASSVVIGSGKLMSGDATLTDSSVSVGGNWTSGVTKLTNSTATVTSLNALDTTLNTNSVVQITTDSTTSKLMVLGGSQFKIGAGAKLTTTDDTLSGGSKVTVGDGSTLLSTSITLSLGSAIIAGNGSTVSTTGALSATDSSLTFGNTGTLTAASTTLANSAITMGTTATATLGAVVMTKGSTLTLGSVGMATLATLAATDSTLNFGTGNKLTATGTTLTNSGLTMGAAPTASLGTVVMTKGSSISLGAGGSATLADLTITDSSFAVGDGTTTTVQNIGLTNSSITLGTSGTGADMKVSGNITVGASTNPSFINGPGGLGFLSANQTVTIADGAANQDLAVSAKLFGADFIKNGPGRLVANALVPSAVGVTVQNGDLEVDATIGNVTLTSVSSSLSGTGTVGTLGLPVIGTVTPGVSYAANKAGILRGTSAVWGSQTVYSINLSSSTPGSPAAGTDYDQVQLTGTINLGGATLTGTFGTGIQFNDRFTIITAPGGVTGKFAEPFGAGVVFIQGQKFRVDYSDPMKVVLQKIRADVTVTVISSANPSTFGQLVTFTVTVTPEPGAALIPTTTNVTFTLDGTPQTPVVSVNASSQAVFSVLLTGGTHTISATFNGDPVNFNTQTSTTLIQTVEVPTIDPLIVTPSFISPNNSPGIQDTTSVTTTVRQERSATTWTVTIKNSSNATVRTFTGAGVIAINTFPISAIWNGKDSAGAFVPDGVYALTATFLDQFANTQTTPVVSVTVDNTSPAVSPILTSSPVIAPGTTGTASTTTTLTSTITEQNLSTWAVNIFNSANVLVRSYSGTGLSVNVNWDGRNGLGVIVPDGTYTVSVTAGDAAGNTVTSSTQTVIVLTQPPAITVTSPSTNVYGQAITLIATVSVANPLAANLLNGTLVQFFNNSIPVGGPVALTLAAGRYEAMLTTSTLNVGSYSITASYLGTTNFLANTSPAYTLVVTPASVNVTALNQTKVYGGPLPVLTYAVSGLVNGDTVASVFTGAVATTATSASSVGMYPITQGSLVSNTNYVVTFTNASLTVTTAMLNVTANNLTKTYGAATPPLTFTTNGLVNNDTVATVLTGALATTANALTPAGSTVPISQGTLAANANYSLNFVNGALTVTKAALSVTAVDKTKLYGSAVPSLTFTTTGLVNNETVAQVLTGGLTTTATAASSVGNYPITIGTLAANSNYALTFVNGTLSVTPVALLVTANSLTSVYGKAIPPLTFSVNGLLNGDTSATVLSGSLTTTATSSSPVGTYPIAQGTLVANTNYTLTVTNGKLTLTPAPLTIAALNATKVYGGPLPPLTFTVNGLLNSDTVGGVVAGSLVTTATPASSVGTYPVTQGSLTTNANYTLTAFTPSNLSVTPASFTVTANNITASLGLAVPPLTYQVQGLVNGDTQAVFAGSLATTFVPGTHVGTYPITRGSLTTTSPNYTLSSFVDATLRVVSRPGMVGYSQFAVGADNGRTDVNVYNADGSGRFSSNAYPGTDNGARTAAADFTGDGVADVVVASGPGRTTSVVILDGVTQKVIFSIQPFEDGFTGGINVSAGDLTGDGIADLVITPDNGGGPRVRVFNGKTFTQLADFFGIEDPNFRGGARTAVGDLNGDGTSDLVVAAGFGGGPRIAGFDGTSLGGTPLKLFSDFFAFEQQLRNGAYVAVGDLNGDGMADVITGGGPGGGPRVLVFDGRDLLTPVGGTQTPIANFFAGNPDNRSGIRLAVKDLDGDTKADLVVGAGAGAGNHVTAYLGKTIMAATSTPAAAYEFDPYQDFPGGVFVG